MSNKLGNKVLWTEKLSFIKLNNMKNEICSGNYNMSNKMGNETFLIEEI